MNPPNSDPNNFPSPFDPIPPSRVPGGAENRPGASGLGLSPRPGKVTLEAISEGWKLLQPNMGAWIGGTIMYIGIVAIFEVLSIVIQGKSATSIALGLLVTVLGSAANVILYGGLLKMAVETVKTGKSNIAEILGVSNLIVSLCVGAFLTTVGSYVGLLFCILPGIYIAMCLSMTQLVIVDQKLGPIDAMRLSWKTVKPQWREMFTFLFVGGLVAIAGFLACGVGILVTFPLLILSTAVVYRDLFGNSPVEMAPVIYPTAPIADPNN